MADINDALPVATNNRPTSNSVPIKIRRYLITFIGLLAKLTEYELRALPYLTISFIFPVYFIHQEYQYLLELKQSGIRLVHDNFPFAVIRVGFFLSIALVGSRRSNTYPLDGQASMVDSIAALITGTLSRMTYQLDKARRLIDGRKPYIFWACINIALSLVCSILGTLTSSFPLERQYTLDQSLAYLAIVIIQFNTRCIINLITFLTDIICGVEHVEGEALYVRRDSGLPAAASIIPRAMETPQTVVAPSRCKSCPDLRSRYGACSFSTHSYSDVNTARGRSNLLPSDSVPIRFDHAEAFRELVVGHDSALEDVELEGLPSALSADHTQRRVGDEEATDVVIICIE